MGKPSEFARVPKLDVSTCTPDRFQICKQRWNSAVTIMAFPDLPTGTQQALFTNVLSDDSVKRMNSFGLQDVNAIIKPFQIQVPGSSSIFDHEYEFHNKSHGTNKSFRVFYTDMQTLLNKCHYKDCRKTETRMSCKRCVILARLVAGIRSNEVHKSLVYQRSNS